MSRLRNWKFTNWRGGDWSVEWWDGKGCYIGSDVVRWWEIPYSVYLICKEQVP